MEEPMAIMQSIMTEQSTDRMPCKPSTKLRYSDFVAGLGNNVTYDDALILLLGMVCQDGESEHQAGRRLRQQYIVDEPASA
jgi:hypothetical protein